MTEKQFSGDFPSEIELRAQKEAGIDIYKAFLPEAIRRGLEAKEKKLYTEEHHICPQHSGGDNSPENLVHLTFNDHTIAHYLRWIAYGHPGDKTAYLLMSGQTEDVRRERAQLGGTIGGPRAQAANKQNKIGWFNSDTQRKLGLKGAQSNRDNKTGAWSPLNSQILESGRKKMEANIEQYLPQRIQNLETGRETQKKLKINLGDPEAQRLKSIGYWGITLPGLNNGVKYFIDTEQRCYLCETTLAYYLKFAPKKQRSIRGFQNTSEGNSYPPEN